MDSTSEAKIIHEGKRDEEAGGYMGDEIKVISPNVAPIC
jgi:hypothetical protein